VISRYIKILLIQLRASATVGIQYRFDFVVEGLMTLFWMAVTLTPLFVLFGQRENVAGWSYPEALVVVGWFTLLKGVLEGAINPSLLTVIDHVRKGTLDFILLKPLDAQFLVSTARFDPWRLFDGFGALAIFGYAFTKLGRFPGPLDLATAAVLLVAATLVLYSIWILVISSAFVAVRVDNLSYLIGSIFDAARWPISVFKGTLRFVFTFVFPLALMTSYPAMALLGRLDVGTAALALGGAMAFAVASRRVWRASIRHYTSASS
jgi:ABC-2 type transport system permease protein